MEIVGHIIRYLFKASENDYKIAKIETEQGEELIIVGYFPLLTKDLDYEFTGDMVTHKKFGEQLRVTNFKKSTSMSKQSIISYLSGSDFKGVGPTIAARIYETLGPLCISKIKEDPNSLSLVKGLSKNKHELIAAELNAKAASEDIFIELYNYGLTTKMASKLFAKYSFETLDKIRKNPYRLLYEIDGFGFLKTDALANHMGITSHDKNRLSQGLIFTLSEVCNNDGYTFLTESQLLNKTVEMLNKNRSDLIDIDELEGMISDLVQKNLIVEEEDRIYPKDLYDSEVEFADKIEDINTFESKKYNQTDILDAIKTVEKTLDIKYTKNQKEALLTTASDTISIITGGPGTGKTTLILGIIHLYCVLNGLEITSDKIQNDLVLCAPTGRAAKRMGEQTSFPSYTIHKTLGYTFEREFGYNKDNKLPGKFLICDEFSMVDITLANSLFVSLNENMKVILVGDENQLPSVKPGNVLHDLIASDIIHTVRLTEIMRQAKNSPIIELGRQINNQHINYSIFNGNNSLYFYSLKGQDVIDGIEKIIRNFIAKGGNLITDIIVLAPMYKGVCGIDAINKMVQNKFNNSENKLTRNGKTFKLHDKVLQLKNEPEKDIMNGDIGEIIDISKVGDDTLVRINFDGNVISYGTNFSHLTLAYAISIHKSQGSEFNNVIMPVVFGYYYMLQKKIIYTGVTRAKNKLIMLGEYQSLLTSLNKESDTRQTSLYRRLTRMISKNSKTEIIDIIDPNVIYINDPSIPFDKLGEQNMEGITPYTFMDDDEEIF